MIEALRTPGGRIAIGVVASAMIVALILFVEAGMVAFTPVLLLPVWVSLFAGDGAPPRPGVLKLFLALGVAALVAGLVVYFVLS